MRDLFVPVMGMAPDDVTFIGWNKSSGDPVADGEVVAVVETSKAELEIHADTAGVLGPQLVDAGDILVPGAVIGSVVEPDDPAQTSQVGELSAPTDADGPPVTAVVDGAVAPPPVDLTASAPSSKNFQQSGQELDPRGASADVDLSTSGLRTTSDRVKHIHRISPRQRRLQAQAAASAAAADTTATRPVVPPPPPPPRRPARTVAAAPGHHPPVVDRFREAVAAAVTRSWQEIPHFTVTRELHVDPTMQAIDRWRVLLPQLTLTDLLLRATALMMMERERTSVINVGLAVATDRGVAIPVIRNVLALGMVELVDARRHAVDRARSGRLHTDDAAGAATTLSNLGAVGVDQFTGIVPHDQTSILTIGRAADRPIVTDGVVRVACTMQATLNVDHRSWDGLHAGLALDRLAKILATPEPLLAPSAPAGTSSSKDV